MNRRKFNKNLLKGVAGLSVATPLLFSCNKRVINQFGKDRFRISLAEWSLHKAIKSGKLDHLGFAQKAKSLGFGAIEYVSQFFDDKVSDRSYLREMNLRANDIGVKQLLIMVDIPGKISDVDPRARQKAVEDHFYWVDAAHKLGCHSIRVNLFGSSDRSQVANASIDGMSALGEYASQANINIIVENHGQFSSDGSWLANVMTKVDMTNCGTLPDFGNFCVRREGGELWGAPCVDEYDKYKGVEEMMPFAKAVSAKAFDFDANGNETTIDFKRMIDIIKASKYSGYIGVEYEGENHSEDEGILLTKELLERLIV